MQQRNFSLDRLLSARDVRALQEQRGAVPLDATLFSEATAAAQWYAPKGPSLREAEPQGCWRRNQCYNLRDWWNYYEYSSYCNFRGTKVVQVGSDDTCGHHRECESTRRCDCYGGRFHGPQCQLMYTLTQELSLTHTSTETVTASRSLTPTESIPVVVEQPQYRARMPWEPPCHFGQEKTNFLVMVMVPTIASVFVLVLVIEFLADRCSWVHWLLGGRLPDDDDGEPTLKRKRFDVRGVLHPYHGGGGGGWRWRQRKRLLPLLPLRRLQSLRPAVGAATVRKISIATNL